MGNILNDELTELLPTLISCVSPHQQVIDSMEKVARQERHVSHLFTAMGVINRECILSRYSESDILSRDDRDHILTVLAKIESFASELLPAYYDHQTIKSGFRAIAAQIIMWSETPEQTAQRSPQHVTNVGMYARIFRNNLENLHWASLIDQRAHARRENQIRELCVAAERKTA